METDFGIIFFVVMFCLFFVIGIIMHRHYKKINHDPDSKQSKLEINLLRMYKQIAIIFIFFSIVCMIIFIIDLLRSL